MKLLLILIFVSQSFSLDIFEQYIKQNGDSTLNGSLTIADDLTVDTETLFVDSSNNLVGINTASPNGQFHVIGETFIDSAKATKGGAIRFASNANVAFLATNSYYGTDFSGLGGDAVRAARNGGAGLINFDTTTGGTAGNISFATSPNTTAGAAQTFSTRMTLTESGELVVGATSTSYGIEASNGAVAGNGAYVNTSDKRLKENQEALTGACALVDQLTPLLYDWKSVVPSSYRTWANGFQFYDEDGNLQDGENQVNKQKHGLKDVGFFAQDVETVFPQAVSTTSKGRYNLQYEKFIPLLVACIQEMRR